MGRSAEEMFWEKTIPEPNTGCWLWMGHVDKDGYGLYGNRDKSHSGRRAPRLAWAFTYGAAPDGLFVCHRCDNPACVNPGHLFLGTPADNMADRDAKNRHATGDRNGSRRYPERRPRGERQGKAKLTADIVTAMRRRYASGGISLMALAREYGVSDTAVFSACARRTWRHVP